MEHPICLIKNLENGDLVVNPEAEKILSEMNQAVVVVAIIGKYRTGKSYLMNKLAGKSNGFALGSTIQSKTKGIWMWCLPHPKKPEYTLVLLDTEGLGDVEKGDCKNDAWIFSLAVLLSSTMVFNSVGTIDQSAMEQLNYVTELTERIQVTSKKATNVDEDDDGFSEMKRFFPSFIWCVRDFNLELKVNGADITEDQYLQNSLKLKKGIGAKVYDYNAPRECIRHFFHSHKCFVFERPAPAQGLKQLESLHESQLEPQFLEQTKLFCSYVYDHSKPKTITSGLTVTGKLLYNLAVTYVEAIQSGAVPCMENAVKTLTKIENTRAVNEAVATYDEKMSQRTSKFPTETQEQFLQMHKQCETEAQKVFRDLSFKDDDMEYFNSLLQSLAQKTEIYYQCNVDESIRICNALIQDLNGPLEMGIKEEKYSKPGGHCLFQQELSRVIEAYNDCLGKGIKAADVLQEFLQEKEKTGAMILQTDQSLTEHEKKIAEQKAKVEAEERVKLLIEEKNQRLQETIESEKKSREEQLRLLHQKYEQEKQKMKEENEWLIQERQKEMEQMMKEGMSKQSDMLQEEIQNLQRQNEATNQRSTSDAFAAALPGVLGTLLKKLLSDLCLSKEKKPNVQCADQDPHRVLLKNTLHRVVQ